jgi:hypothetical protein
MTDLSAQGETFAASRLTRGNLFFPTLIVVNSESCVAHQAAALWQQPREYRGIESGVGTDFDGDVLVGYTDRFGGRDESHFESWAQERRCGKDQGLDREISESGGA